MLRRLALSLTLACAATLVTMVNPGPVQAADLARDAFERSVPSGWGTADTGGAWTTSGPQTAFSVGNGAGRLTVPAGSSRTALLEGLNSESHTLTMEFSVDTVAEATYVALIGRQVGAERYVGRLRVQADGRAKLYLLRNSHSLSSSALIPNLTVTPGTRYRMKLQVSGTAPTTLAAKVWPVSGSEPASWQETGTDSASALQRSGRPGIFAYLSPSSNRPSVNVSVQDLAITSAASSAPPASGSTPSSPAASATDSGAAAVGSTSYPVPSNAVFAVAGGGVGGNGTASSPYQSAQTAISKAPSGSTVVLRSGTYRESISVPFNKKLTIQPYPNEAVWFDGSGPVTGWVKNGSTWVVSNWNHIFDNRVSFGAGQDETSRWVDPAHPMAGHPDQVWINGSELKQVSRADQVTAGSFYVDRSNKRLIIGSDPTGKLVEASKIAKAWKIQGAGTTVRGIGVRRYANHVALMGAITAEVSPLTFENVVVKDNATTGLFAWGDDVTLRNVTLSGNGLLGLGANEAQNLQLTNVAVSGNNDERFKETPVSGGLKIANSDNVRITGSTISDNTTFGLWFDVSSRRMKVVHNRIVGNGGHGLLVELSNDGIIADNLVARNGKTGLWLFNSSNMEVWNNTLDRNDRSFAVWQDERRQPNSQLAALGVTWVTKNVNFHNNVTVYGGNFCPILTQDLTQKWYGNDFDLDSQGNLYHRPSASNPSRFVCWANGSAGTKSFPSLGVYATETGNDTKSRAYDGASILTSSGALVGSVASETSSLSLGLPATVAAATGRPTGERTMGARFGG